MYISTYIKANLYFFLSHFTLRIYPIHLGISSCSTLPSRCQRNVRHSQTGAEPISQLGWIISCAPGRPRRAERAGFYRQVHSGSNNHCTLYHYQSSHGVLYHITVNSYHITVNSYHIIVNLCHIISYHSQFISYHSTTPSLIHLPIQIQIPFRIFQVPKILAPIAQAIEKLSFGADSQETAFEAYVKAEWGSFQGLRMQIMSDFFKHGFDGSGDDGGSCIDGRLTRFVH